MPIVTFPRAFVHGVSDFRRRCDLDSMSVCSESLLRPAISLARTPKPLVTWPRMHDPREFGIMGGLLCCLLHVSCNLQCGFGKSRSTDTLSHWLHSVEQNISAAPRRNSFNKHKVMKLHTKRPGVLPHTLKGLLLHEGCRFRMCPSVPFVTSALKVILLC
jgi:hypothetical protein